MNIVEDIGPCFERSSFSPPFPARTNKMEISGFPEGGRPTPSLSRGGQRGASSATALHVTLLKQICPMTLLQISFTWLSGCHQWLSLWKINRWLIQGYLDGESILTHYINHASFFFLVGRKWQSEREDKQTEVEHDSGSKSGQDGDGMKVKRCTCCWVTHFIIPHRFGHQKKILPRGSVKWKHGTSLMSWWEVP